jgi:hypothetical protein
MLWEKINSLWIPVATKPKGEKSITVFLDESADEKQDTVYVVAGYIGADANWKNFASEWNACLAGQGLQGETFHTNLFDHGGHEPWKTLKAQKKPHEDLLNCLLAVIRKHALYPFGAMALLCDYRAMTDKGPWDDPYKLCLEVALFAANELCVIAPGGAIQFVCDENQKLAKWVDEAFTKLKSNNPALANVFANLEFGTDDRDAELCAADLVAFEVRKHVYNGVHHPHVKMRYPMKRILNDGPSRFWRVDFSNVVDPKQLWNPEKT